MAELEAYVPLRDLLLEVHELGNWLVSQHVQDLTQPGRIAKRVLRYLGRYVKRQLKILLESSGRQQT